MLRDDKLEVKAEQEAQECYCDPLFDSVEGAFSLALRLLDAGMIGFTIDFQDRSPSSRWPRATASRTGGR